MNECTGMSEEPGPVAPGWEGELRALYADLDRQVAAIGPVCELSGRCCRFLEFGHTLFVSRRPRSVIYSSWPQPLVRLLDQRGAVPGGDLRGALHAARTARPKLVAVFAITVIPCFRRKATGFPSDSSLA